MTRSRVLYGFHAVTARLRRGSAGVEEVFLDSSRSDARARELGSRVQALGLPLRNADPERLRGLCGHDGHQGVVAIVAGAMPHTTLDDVLATVTEPALLLVLDGVQDPHNLGACLRCADVFGAHAIVVPRDRAVGVNATVAKVASGAADTVPVISVTNLARAMRELKEVGVWLFGGDAEGGEDLFGARVEGAVAWVLGAEGTGLRRLTRELCDRIVAIPQFGSVASLNVSVAAGICLYETRRQRASSIDIDTASS
jgi:23S rRNA (guanosine2251-2'-O)-methyltransferase